MQVDLKTIEGCKAEKRRLIEMVILGLLVWLVPFNQMPWVYGYGIWALGAAWMIVYTSVVIESTRTKVAGLDSLMIVITGMLWPITMPFVGFMRLKHLKVLIDIKIAKRQCIRIHTAAYFKNAPNWNGITVNHDEYEAELNKAIDAGTSTLRLSAHHLKQNTVFGRITHATYNEQLNRFDMYAVLSTELPSMYYDKMDNTKSIPVFGSFNGTITNTDGEQYSTCESHSGYYLDGELKSDDE